MESLKQKVAVFLRNGDGSGSGFGYGYGSCDGDGFGYGSGYGYGDGFGDGSGSGSGYGDGSGSGSGSGYGYGSCDGDGFGYGSGYGSGSGYGDGSGSGSGYGSGDGFGSGSGSGSGYGDGSGDGLVSSINHLPTAVVDGVLTAFSRVHGTVAKGYIVRGDLSMKPCYVVKSGALFAHGETLRDAMSALRGKMFEDMPEEDRIRAFVAEHKGGVAYPNTDLFDWHHRLTGSCLMGRKEFVASHGIDMDGSTTPEDFIRLTEHAFGGDVIRKLRGFYDMD